jgi:argininosuccinate lyase
MLKGLPFAYNRDLQEDKEPLFDSIDTLQLVLPAVTGMIATTEFDREKMLSAAPQGFSLATEVADFLVRADVPFAQAHEAAGKCVAICEAKGLQLHELSDAEFAGVHPSLTADIRKSLTVNGAISSRNTVGATGPAALKKQLSEVASENSAAKVKISKQISTFSEMMGR